MSDMNFKQANQYILEHLRSFLGDDLVDGAKFTRYKGTKQLEIKIKNSLYTIALEGDYIGRYMNVYKKKSGDLIDLLLELKPDVARLAGLARVNQIADQIGKNLL